MNMKILGILLVTVGTLLLLYKGITYKTHEKVLDLGSLQVTQVETKTFPVSPIFGVVALVGGIALIWFSVKRVS